MSTNIEDREWLNSTIETFNGALEVENWRLCRNVTADTKEAGYADESKVMQQRLDDAMKLEAQRLADNTN